MNVSLTMYTDSVVLFAEPERPDGNKIVRVDARGLGRMEADIRILLAGLQCFHLPANLTIRTKSKYIYGSLKWLDRWADNGWVNSKGKPVRYIGLWQQVHEKIKMHRYAVELY